MTSIPKIILASTSVFRRALLERLEIPFEVISPAYEEVAVAGESPEEMVQRQALGKAKAVQAESGLVIGSDQCAALDDRILGKPGNHEKAAEQLRASSGRTVRFHTGLCLLNAATGHYQVDNVIFEVSFRKLSESQFQNYLAREQPYQCAGSFKSEALGIALFESMQGEDPSSLVGLPLIRLTSMFAEEGIILPLAAD